MTLASSKASLRSKSMSLDQVLTAPNAPDPRQTEMDFNMDFLVIIIHDVKANNMSTILEITTQRKVQKTLIVVNDNQVTALKTGLRELKSNSYFYVLKVGVSFRR